MKSKEIMNQEQENIFKDKMRTQKHWVNNEALFVDAWYWRNVIPKYLLRGLIK